MEIKCKENSRILTTILYKTINTIVSVIDNPFIGFVEMAGYNDFAYIVWEEGKTSNPDKGMKEDSKIVVAILYHDGRLIGLF